MLNMCYLNTQAEQKTIREFKSNNGVECYLCHKTINTNEIVTVDHKLPKSRGGLTITENLAICCQSCNSEKSDMNEQEYKDYLINKEYVLKNNNTLKTITDMILVNTNVVIKFVESTKLLSSAIKEKLDIEKCIKSLKFNASEGYVLCRDMKDNLNKIDNLTKETNRLHRLQALALIQKKELQKTYNEIIEEITKDIRREMGIGNLGLKKSA
jgi:hypothetical protein